LHKNQKPRKVSQPDLIRVVPTTDTGGLVEKTKVSGRTLLKEFGKSAGRTFAICPARFNNRATTKAIGGTV
jgi:hypothetical protein